MPAEILKKANSAAVTEYKSHPAHHCALVTQLPCNHPPTTHCGFTLIGDQNQTIIQAYTSPEKIAKASYTVKSHLTRPHTIFAVKVSKQQPSQPCAFDTQLRATHLLLKLSLGCLEMQTLTASPLHFERPPPSEFALIYAVFFPLSSAYRK